MKPKEGDDVSLLPESEFSKYMWGRRVKGHIVVSCRVVEFALFIWLMVSLAVRAFPVFWSVFTHTRFKPLDEETLSTILCHTISNDDLFKEKLHEFNNSLPPQP